jgi:hypothetical protein
MMPILNKRMVTMTLDDATIERMDAMSTNRSAFIREIVAELYARKVREGQLLVEAS